MILANQAELHAMENAASDVSGNISRVILHPSVFIALRMSEPTTIRFMVANIGTLLSLTFSENVSSAESTSSFEILLMMIPEITSALIGDGIFYNFVNKLLSFDQNDSVIGRLSNLTFKLIESGLPGSLDSCGFLFKLLKYADNTSVTDLFVGLLEVNQEFEMVQRWMANRCFSNLIINHLKELEIENVSNNQFMSVEIEKLCSFYEMIEMGIKNPILNHSFKGKDIIESLSYKQELVCFAEEQRWKAIIALTNSISNKSGIDQLKPLILLAKKFLMALVSDNSSALRNQPLQNSPSNSTENPQPHVYHLQIINFLQITLPNSYDSEIIQNLLTILKKFPNCSYFHLEIINFIRQAMKDKLVDDKTLKIIAKYVVSRVQETTQGSVAHATAMKLFIDVSKFVKKHRKAKKATEKVEGFEKYAKVQLKSYLKMMDAEYGKEPRKFSLFNKV
ncbi:hypothetical protein TRFO_11345 [Tritrichomonas foetus]|uniref:Uncharacterized protein n=1 Tax=Tritrichomonas foetus TaxID=1144522 RepID=A0A1J4J5Z6_9EUKA|nr:hypothetical protein TRFO_11345 [Tritrichomonas foetus]|eukprot:OHS94089.1 hypothetical protein TRFO_11345 [Tritrichomonas foetus]